MTLEPRHPIYIVSKGRSDIAKTATFMERDGVKDFHLVVEPQEAEAYAANYGEHRVYVLPFSNLGLGSIPARNWCWEHSISLGAERHWCFDDNIDLIAWWKRGRRHLVDSRIALHAAEDFTDRYTNIGITGFNYWMFATGPAPPFRLNAHVYSSLLIDNAMPYRWRGRYNEDTDLCLQVLSGGLCIVQINAFLIKKQPTMQMRGGNTDELYLGDGRLAMARSLERQWPGIATVSRRYGRPQHVIENNWKSFDTKLIRRTDVDFDALDSSKYEMTTERVRAQKRIVSGKFNLVDDGSMDTPT